MQNPTLTEHNSVMDNNAAAKEKANTPNDDPLFITLLEYHLLIHYLEI